MAAAAVSENQPTTVNLTALPGTDGIRVDANGAIHVREETGKRLAGEADPNAGEEIAHAGRLRFAEGSLRATGVLPDIERDRLVAALRAVRAVTAAGRDEDRCRASVLKDDRASGFQRVAHHSQKAAPYKSIDPLPGRPDKQA